jgi:glyoxylase-like metal-dependent hydrolase (beta-lactamase superfamily II)
MQNELLVKDHPIHTIDLNFMGIEGSIACFLIPHRNGVVLIECGPGSTVPVLQVHLSSHGFSAEDVTDVLLTHIHLDHAGAAGWFAERGAQIHVHPIGAPHLIDPQKLLTSAGRIYGEKMDLLWGEFLPVPESQLTVQHDREVIQIEDLSFLPLETTGHASHHFAYLLEGACFSGDIAGVRMAGARHIRLPMPPPEFHLEGWRNSLEILYSQEITHILPTHFGIFSDPEWHLGAVGRALDEVDAWMIEFLPQELPQEEVEAEFLNWERGRANADLINSHDINVYRTANPSEISMLGIQRYWRKYRQEP